MNTRWFNAILAERGVSQRELCRRLGLDESAMSLTFRGKRQMKMTEAVDIARLLGVPLGDVLENAGLQLDATGIRTVPVVGHIDGDGAAHIDWKAKKEKVNAPSELPEDAAAVIAKSADGPYWFVDGWAYFIAQPSNPTPEIVGRYCVVGVKGNGTMLRFVRRGYKAGTYNLATPTGSAMENVTIEWASPVLLIRPA